MKQGIIYIAAPYTSHRATSAERGAEQHARFTVITRYAAAQMRDGWAVFSPITHGHPIWMHSGCELDASAAGWAEVNLAMLRASRSLHVLRLKGWERSTGLEDERRWWRGFGGRIPELLVDLEPHWFDSPMLQTYCMPDDHR